jgi:hypothetical protein
LPTIRPEPRLSLFTTPLVYRAGHPSLCPRQAERRPAQGEAASVKAARGNASLFANLTVPFLALVGYFVQNHTTDSLQTSRLKKSMDLWIDPVVYLNRLAECTLLMTKRLNEYAS